MLGINRDIVERKIETDENNWNAESVCTTFAFPQNGWTNHYKLIPNIGLFDHQKDRLINVGKDMLSFSVKAEDAVTIGFFGIIKR